MTLKFANPNNLYTIAGQPVLDLRFAINKSLTDHITGSNNLISFSRTSVGTFLDSDGILKVAPENQPRFTHDEYGNSLGFLSEDQRTNVIRNNTILGAVVGTPGTLPTNWSSNVSGGITRQIVNIGNQNGINYIDIRFFGTNTNSNANQVQPEAFPGISGAASGQTWTASSWLAIVGGSITGLNAVIRISERNDAGSQTGYTDSVVNLTSTLTRFSATRLLNDATTSRISNDIVLTPTGTNLNIDITLRIGLPQLEQGPAASSVILTTGSSRTRSSDYATISGTNFTNFYSNTGSTLLIFARSIGPSLGNEYAGGFGGPGDGVHIREAQPNIGVFGMFRGTYGLDAGGGTLPVGLRKMCIAYSPSTFGVFTLNGVNYTSPVAVSATPTAPDSMGIGNPAGGTTGNNWNGPIERVIYWPSKLSNSILQSLTL